MHWEPASDTTHTRNIQINKQPATRAGMSDTPVTDGTHGNVARAVCVLYGLAGYASGSSSRKRPHQQQHTPPATAAAAPMEEEEEEEKTNEKRRKQYKREQGENGLLTPTAGATLAFASMDLDRQSSSSSSHVKSTPHASRMRFDQVMVEPCMANLFSFLPLRDRFRVMSVGRSWYVSARRASLWATTSWECKCTGDSAGGDIPSQRGEEEEETTIKQMPPEWIRTRLGGLKARYLNILGDPQQLLEFSQCTRLRHLELSQSAFHTPPSQSAQLMKQVRVILHKLRLVSFVCYDLHPILSESIFGSPSALVDPLDESTQPAIYSWSNSLENLQLIFYKDARTFISRIIYCLCQREWSRLSCLELTVYPSIDLSQDQLNALEYMLHPRHIPAIIQFNVKLDIHTAIPETFFLAVHHSLTTYLSHMQRFNFDITVRDERDESKVTHCNMKSYPLATSHIKMHSLITEWHTLAPLINLRDLRIFDSTNRIYHTNNDAKEPTLVQLFEAIGAHNLPHLHTLQLSRPSELIELEPALLTQTNSTTGSGSSSRAADHQRCRAIMAGMQSLTELHTIYDAVDSTTHFHFADALHQFPSLRVLHLSGGPARPYQSMPLAPHTDSTAPISPYDALFRSIQAAPKIEELVIQKLSIIDVDRLMGGCRPHTQPSHTVHLQSPPPPIAKLTLNLIANARSTQLTSIVDHLAHMTRLTQLSIERWPDEEEEEEEETDTDPNDDNATHMSTDSPHGHPSHAVLPSFPSSSSVSSLPVSPSYLFGLTRLVHLRHLALVEDAAILTPPIMQHWTAEGQFAQMRTIALTLANDETGIDEIEADEGEEEENADDQSHAMYDDAVRVNDAVVASSASSRSLVDFSLFLRLPSLHSLILISVCAASDSRDPFGSSHLMRAVRHANHAGRQPTLEVMIDTDRDRHTAMLQRFGQLKL